MDKCSQPGEGKDPVMEKQGNIENRILNSFSNMRNNPAMTIPESSIIQPCGAGSFEKPYMKRATPNPGWL